jgi:cell division septal protein FtsQ
MLVGLVALGAAAWSSLGPSWFAARLAGIGLFRIEEVHVAGNTALAASEVQAAAGLRRGGSVLGVDLGAARERLVALPRVRAANLRRRLPGTILIDIVERVPCAVVRADRSFLVDAEGAIVGTAGPAESAGLPVLMGVEILAGALTARGHADLAAGLDLIAAVRQAGFPALVAIDHIDMADADDAVIVPVAGRPLVHAGRGDAAAQLTRWRLVAPDMARRWPELEYVDLRVEGQIVALPAAPAQEAESGAKAGAAGRPQQSPGSGKGTKSGAAASRTVVGGGHA